MVFYWPAEEKGTKIKANAYYQLGGLKKSITYLIT
jgi:hypothetical protein